VTQADIDNWFTYHPPMERQLHRYKVLRGEFKRLAEMVVEMTPPCADQTVAIRKIREASMAVNMAIACNE
jgi:hypothetical protein